MNRSQIQMASKDDLVEEVVRLKKENSKLRKQLNTEKQDSENERTRKLFLQTLADLAMRVDSFTIEDMQSILQSMIDSGCYKNR